MRKFFAFLLVFLLIAAGLAYLFYPTVSNQIGQAKDGEVMKAYREKTALMSAEQINEMLADADEYNAALEKVEASDPFSGELPRTSRDYQNRLNVHSGVIGELVIPAIGIYLPVYHNCGETPATMKLVHLETSSLPSERTGTSIVLAGPGVLKAEGFLGEIGLTDERMLQDLDRLTPGDLIILNVLNRTMVYRIGEGLEEKDAILMLTPGGVKDLDLSLSAVQAPEPEPEPTQTPEPRYTPKPTATPDPEAETEAEAGTAEETQETSEITPEPEPTPTPTPTPVPEPEEEPEEEQSQTMRPATEQLTLLTPWRDQKLLVVRSARIPIDEARELLSETDRATYPEPWKNVLLLGCPVLILGFLVMFVIERIKRRSYMLPDEGRQSARREKKNKAKLDTLAAENKEQPEETTTEPKAEPDKPTTEEQEDKP